MKSKWYSDPEAWFWVLIGAVFIFMFVALLFIWAVPPAH